MLTAMLHRTKQWLYHNPVRKPLDKMGVTRLGRRYFNRKLISCGVFPTSILDIPLTLVVDSDQLISEIEAASREARFIGGILERMKDHDVFFDVGANIGIVSMLVAKRSPGADVHSFEPEPRNADYLRRNISTNGLDRITVHECAVGAEPGSVRLYVAAEAGAGTHSIMSDGSGDRESIDVPMVTIDTVAEQISADPTIMKIDVEGAEMDVLRGMEGVLRRGSIRELFVEVHPRQLATQGESAESLSSWLGERGMKLVETDRRDNEFHQRYVRDGGPTS